MKISKRGEYALRALIDIGIAKELGRDLVQINELAAQERLPVKFLEQILTQLKESGYVDSKRGKYGGYHLKMPAERVRFGNVIRLIDGPLAPIACVSQTAYEPCTCPDEEHCGLHMLMLDVRNSIANILDNYTLSETVEVTLRKMRRDRVPLPFQGVGRALASMAKTPARARKPRPAGKARPRGKKIR
jgi:Rrf2 family protein